MIRIPAFNRINLYLQNGRKFEKVYSLVAFKFGTLFVNQENFNEFLKLFVEINYIVTKR